MSPEGQLSAHVAVKLIIMGAPNAPPKPGNPPPSPGPASDGPVGAVVPDDPKAKQQTCPLEQWVELEHESEDPLHDPADVQVVEAAPPKPPTPPPKPPNPPPPSPGKPASAEGAAGAAGAP
jgi:hypothetical protein